MFVAVEQTTWDLIAQIGVWFVGLPALLLILGWYIYAQVTVERRENRTLDGRWGLAAKAKAKSSAE